MPKIAKQLTALEVQKLKKPGRHAVGGAAGLCLEIKESGTRSWILCVKIGNRRRYIGLGSFPSISLKEAREAALEKRKFIIEGKDPILEKKAIQNALKQKQQHSKTFEECAYAYIESKQSEWNNAKHREQWTSTLKTYAYPFIGKQFVSDIDITNVLEVLKPIWTTKTETANRLRGRIEKIIDSAIASGYRKDANPAQWKGLLDTKLPSPKKIKNETHHKAVPVNDIGAFMQRLKKQNGTASKALEFLILTAARSGEVRGAKWSEIDFEKSVWSIPAERMKSKKPHNVPLSGQAYKLLKSIVPVVGNDLVFPSPMDKVLSDMTLTAVMRRMEVDAVPHGFRSTFRDWCADKTNYPRDMAEFALAHALNSKTEAAYLRTDMLEKRRNMMQEWADYCNC